VWPPYQGFGTADQADLAKLGSAQLNLMLLHLTLVWQLPIIEHKIGRHGGRSWKWQHPLDKPHNDDDDYAGNNPKQSIFHHHSSLLDQIVTRLVQFFVNGFNSINIAGNKHCK